MRRLLSIAASSALLFVIACSPNAGTSDAGDDAEADAGNPVVGAADSVSTPPGTGSDGGSGTTSDGGSGTHNDGGTSKADSGTSHHGGCGDGKHHEHDDDDDNANLNEGEQGL
jgi:hypothetical protein